MSPEFFFVGLIKSLRKVSQPPVAEMISLCSTFCRDKSLLQMYHSSAISGRLLAAVSGTPVRALHLRMELNHRSCSCEALAAFMR